MTVSGDDGVNGKGDGGFEPGVYTSRSRKQAKREAKRYRRRGRYAVLGAVTILALVAGGIVGSAYWVKHHGPPYVTPKHLASHDDGLLIGGNGPVRVDIYSDYACAGCRTFDAATQSRLAQLAAENRITLIFHPLALSDPAAGSFAVRAADSAACASDIGEFQPYSQALLSALALPAATPSASPSKSPSPSPSPHRSSSPTHSSTSPPTHRRTHRPTPTPTHRRKHRASPRPTTRAGAVATGTGTTVLVEAKPKPTPTPQASASASPSPSITPASAASSSGLTDDQLVQMAAAIGIINPDFAGCLRFGKYAPWVAAQDAAAVAAHVTAPAVLVNGVSIAPPGQLPTAAELTAALGA